MKPPDVIAATRARGDRERHQGNIIARTATIAVYPKRRFVVFVTAFGRLREYSKFGDSESAVAEVRKLQRLGFDGHVKRVMP